MSSKQRWVGYRSKTLSWGKNVNQLLNLLGPVRLDTTDPFIFSRSAEKKKQQTDIFLPSCRVGGSVPLFRFLDRDSLASQLPRPPHAYASGDATLKDGRPLRDLLGPLLSSQI